MTARSIISSNIYVVTIRRSARNEPEAYYMPAPSPEIAEMRVRRIAQAPSAAILSIQTQTQPAH